MSMLSPLLFEAMKARHAETLARLAAANAPAAQVRRVRRARSPWSSAMRQPIAALRILALVVVFGQASSAHAWGPTFGSKPPAAAQTSTTSHDHGAPQSPAGAGGGASVGAEAAGGVAGSGADAGGGGHAKSGASVDRDAIIRDFLATAGGTVPLSAYTGAVREFTLEVHEIETELSAGVFVRQWAYGLAGQPATVPGPELRVTEGDLVRITLHNTHTEPHTIHLHGITTLAMEMDGMPHTSHAVLPGESYTYAFVAGAPGTHAYHCHVQTNLHMNMGMYGALVIEPREPSPLWTQDHTLVLDEWDSRQDPEALVHVSEPDHFLVNGRAYPNIPSLHVAEGEVARLRFVNMGYEPHSLHLHGMSFLVIAKDGHDLAVPYAGDTLPILPGERYDILVRGRDGDFPFHDHIVSNVTTRGMYPGGMHFMLTGGPARDADGTVVGSAHEHGHADTADVLESAEARMERSRDAAAVAADLPLQEGAATVRIVDFAFDAPVIRVKAGTTVTWVNETRASHTVTHGFPGSMPEDRLFDSSGQASGRVTLLRAGQSWSYTFTEPGTYAYYCLPHSYMNGWVVVE